MIFKGEFIPECWAQPPKERASLKIRLFRAVTFCASLCFSPISKQRKLAKFPSGVVFVLGVDLLELSQLENCKIKGFVNNRNYYVYSRELVEKVTKNVILYEKTVATLVLEFDMKCSLSDFPYCFAVRARLFAKTL